MDPLPRTDPSAALRKAKSLAHAFKKNLKASHPWDRQVDSQRQDIRRFYVRLAFDDTHADIAQQLLWSDTSHAVIDVYRAQIQTIEKAIADAKADGPAARRASPHGPVELRKVSQSFRAFLSDEDKFWRQFCLRLVRVFGLTDVMDVLLSVGISDDSIPGQVDDDDDGSLPGPGAAISDQEREKKIDMLQRAIVYLGDLARYRELNEAASVSKSKARGKGPQAEAPKPPTRNFAKSEEYYQAARTLAPENGTPFNQLAILAMYQSHHFDALYFYLRAACTTYPFTTVTENIDRLLSKILESSRRSTSNAEPKMPLSEDHAARLELFEQDVLLLHALWGKKSGSTLEKQSANVESVFPDLLRERLLSSETISRTFFMGCAALYRSRASGPKTVQVAAEAVANDNSYEADPRIFRHLLRFLTTLFEVGQMEVSHQVEGTESTVAGLSLRVSAVFRRMLVTLRLGSRWMKLNLDLIFQSMAEGSDVLPDLTRFWTAYTAFLNHLASSFPRESLPSARGPLEEDFRVRGFLPLLDLNTVALSRHGPLIYNGTNQAHPNEEHLMRIADILSDARYICQQQTQGSPLAFYGGAYFVRGVKPLHLSPPSAVRAAVFASPLVYGDEVDELQDRDDEATDSAGDEDPVDLAMRAALEHAETMSSTDEEDEKILFPPPRSGALVETKYNHHDSKGRYGDDTSHRDGFRTKQAPATAQDLLLQALDTSAGPPVPHTSPVKALPLSGYYITPSVPFGPLLRGGSSIWSGHAPPDPFRTSSSGLTDLNQLGGHDLPTRYPHVVNQTPSGVP